jgi:hypothetical protein
MRNYAQYILCAGKKPVDFRTKQTSNCITDSSAWLSYDAALSESDGHYGIGFVFTESDPFFVIDVDKCVTNGKLSELAQKLVAKFPGAYVEISQSGTGVHIIGCAERMPHLCRNNQLGIELYTEKRFIALTGIQAQGNAETWHTEALQEVIDEYFKPDHIKTQKNTASRWTDDNPAWTTKPHGDWRGYEDDDELIAQAMKSGKIKGKRSFKNLWEGNTIDDGSAADASLAAQLMFWTGGNCARTLELMWLSQLRRDKWERPDYLRRTILDAAAKQTEYHRKPGRPKTKEIKVDPEQTLGTLEFLKSCTYVQEQNKIFVPQEGLMSLESFKTVFSGKRYAMNPMDPDKHTIDALRAFRESMCFEKRRVNNICFDPTMEFGEIRNNKINIYQPAQIQRTKGDASPFTHHIAKLLPDERDQIILTSYLAACVQHAGVKFLWAPVLQGAPGNGKSLISKCLAHAIGSEYVSYPDSRDIDSRFTGWIFQKLIICVEDMYAPGHENNIIERLKPMITNDTQGIQFKGKDIFTAKVCANFIFNTNQKDSIRKHKDDRRYAVFFTAQQDKQDKLKSGMDSKYFNELNAWLKKDGYAIVSEYLYTYDIPEEFNPALGCSEAPDTSTTAQAIEESLGYREQIIMDAIEEGRIRFRNGWVSSFGLKELFEEYKIKMSPSKQKALLASIGIVPHPALKNGRVARAIPEENGKPRLYVRSDCPQYLLTDYSEVRLKYMSDQGYAPE